MKIAWLVLLISAFTDFVITAGGSLTAAMIATGSASLPNHAVILFACLLGSVAMARTIQQALKATPETAAALKGSVSTVTTRTEEKTP